MSYGLDAINPAMEGITGAGYAGGCGGTGCGMAQPSAQSVNAFNQAMNGGEGTSANSMPGSTMTDTSQCAGTGAGDAADNGNGNQAALSGDTMQQLMQLIQSLMQQLQGGDSGEASDSDMASSYQNGGSTNGANGLTSGDCDKCH